MQKRPVVLVHGMLGQRHLYWNLFRHRLEGDGWDVHEAVLPYYLLGDLQEAGNHLANQVERILQQTGAAQADLVCHSAGGLVGRLALRTLGPKVGHLVMMGTANQGTHTAHILAALPFVRMASQVRPGSPLLEELADDPVDPRRIHSLWSTVDGIVLPPANALLPGADNVEATWTGHWMFLWSASVYRLVRGILERDPGGSIAVPTWGSDPSAPPKGRKTPRRRAASSSS